VAGSEARRRAPVTVLLVAVLAFAVGVIGIVHGVGLIADRGEQSVQADTGMGSGGLTAYGLVAIGLGALLAALSISLARGSRSARWTVALLLVVHLASGLAIVFGWYDVSPWEGITSVAVSALLLFLLYGTERSRAFYARA
jgi:hypothetical protein